jgi:hypothetical protein
MHSHLILDYVLRTYNTAYMKRLCDWSTDSSNEAQQNEKKCKERITNINHFSLSKLVILLVRTITFGQHLFMHEFDRNQI